MGPNLDPTTITGFLAPAAEIAKNLAASRNKCVESLWSVPVEDSIMTVSFSPDSRWNEDREIMQFHAIDQLKRIPCAISREALNESFGRGATPLNTFKSNRETIEEIASKLISGGRFKIDGSILIRTSDL